MSVRLLGLHPASRALRALRSRRLAIVLLIILVTFSAVGTAAPQQAQVGPAAYARWTQENPWWAALASQLSLDSLYSAWWFLGLFALLYVNTLACTLPQLRSALARTVRQPVPLDLGARTAAFEMAAPAPGMETLSWANSVLRQRRYRVRRLANGLAADKGLLAAWGSPIFHLGLVVVLTGAAIGGLMGFSGYLELAEGQGFVENTGNYIRSGQGPLFEKGLQVGQVSLLGEGHQGYAVRLDRFTATTSNWGNDIPSQFESEVTILEEGREVGRGAIRINEPLEYRGLSIYPTGASGPAPVFELGLPDGSRETGAVNLARHDQDKYESSLYLPGTIFRLTVRSQEGDPGVGVEVFERGRSLFSGRLYPGQTVAIDEATLKLTDVRNWTGLRVVADPGRMFLYMGFGLTVSGLALSSLVVRREVWMEIVERAEGPVVRLGGHAPRVKALLAFELEDLARDLQAPGKSGIDASETGSSIIARGDVEAWT